MVKSSFYTEKYSINQMLSSGVIYEISEPYQQAEKRLEAIWSKFQTVAGGEVEYCLGIALLVPAPDSNDDYRYQLLVGHQKLITVSLLIVAGVSYLQELVAAGEGAEARDNIERITQLTDSYISSVDPRNLTRNSKVCLKSLNTDLSLDRLLEVTPTTLSEGEKELVTAVNWFKQKISQQFSDRTSAGASLAKFIIQIAACVKFLKITATSKSVALELINSLSEQEQATRIASLNVDTNDTNDTSDTSKGEVKKQLEASVS